MTEEEKKGDLPKSIAAFLDFTIVIIFLLYGLYLLATGHTTDGFLSMILSELWLIANVIYRIYLKIQ